MPLARRTDLGPLADEIGRLRGQVESMQRRRADGAIVPVAPVLASLFPDGGLRAGCSYSITGSTSLLLALLSGASAAGSWCAVLGLPGIGAEAAAGYGVSLDRLVLVPQPGERWVSVAAALSEVVPLIAVHPPRQPHDAELARLHARLRDRGGVLLIAGAWRQAELTLRLEQPHWEGVADGHGLLRSRSVTVSAVGNRVPTPRRVTVQLPGPDGALAALEPPAAAVTPLFPEQRRLHAVAR